MNYFTATGMRTSHCIKHDGYNFETKFPPEFSTEKVTIKGNKAVVSYLTSDSDVGGWYFDDFDQGTFVTLSNHDMGKKLELRYDGESYCQAIERLDKEYPGRVFLINRYEHGFVRYYRHSNLNISGIIDQQWDVTHGCALFIAPDDTPNAAEYCDFVMEDFSSWCNGDIHGICHAVYCKKRGKWELQEDNDQSYACWGYIGYDNAKRELESEHESCVEYLK